MLAQLISTLNNWLYTYILIILLLAAGLYFAGEVLVVDAYTGGFNLQIAWATGRAAGEAAAEQGETA